MRLTARIAQITVLCLSFIMLASGICTANSVVPSPALAALAFQTSSPAEYVTVYASDCTTPQTVFYLGDTVCIQAGNFPTPFSSRLRRLRWAAPNGLVAADNAIKVDPHTEKFVIPTSGDFARVGTWYVSTVNRDANREVRAKFTVRDRWSQYADLVLTKWGPPYIDPGVRVSYRVIVTNPGPDFAEYLEIYDEVPNDMTFYTVKQASGPYVECKTPELGGTGQSYCVAKGLGSGEKLELVFYYVVNREVREGTSFTSSAYSYSQTEEMYKYDNKYSYMSLYPLKDDDGTIIVEDQ